jgi:S1-C subfamily serine protease
MTGLDWVIVGFVCLLALLGWAQGFVAGALALAGFALGAWLGTRAAPLVLPDGAESPYAPLLGLAGAVALGAALAIGLEGLGWRLRGVLRLPGLAVLDGLLGAALSAAVGLGLAWILGAAALQAGGIDLRTEVQRSAILRELNAVLPPSGPLLNALARFDPFPRIDGPEVDVARPRGSIVSDPDVDAAAPSVVKILGTACGLGVAGSGWVAGDGLVVTNAHVVAGQDDTRVLPEGEGGGLDATAVAFDPRNDLAVLRVPGLRAPALPLVDDVASGTPAAILGFPRNGPYDVRAGRVGRTRRVISQDAYGDGPVSRRMTSLRGTVRSGNSGGPMVDGRGRVLTTVFAATTRGPRGGYGVPNAVVREALSRARSGPVSTGPCTG